MAVSRKLNAFEKILLFIGVIIIVIGYIFVHGMILTNGLSWEALQTTFLWLILVVAVILAAVTENMKEELKLVISNQSREISLLRDDMRRRK